MKKGYLISSSATSSHFDKTLKHFLQAYADATGETVECIEVDDVVTEEIMGYIADLEEERKTTQKAFC